jgi:hypothetical protein
LLQQPSRPPDTSIDTHIESVDEAFGIDELGNDAMDEDLVRAFSELLRASRNGGK